MDEVRLQLQAFHESGHAVAAAVLGVPIRRATIRVVTTLVRPGCPQAQRAQAVIALAGPASEAKFRVFIGADELAQLWRTVWATDRDNALRNLAGGNLDLALGEARQLVHAHWAAIERLAQALQEQEELSGREIAEVCQLLNVQKLPQLLKEECA